MIFKKGDTVILTPELKFLVSTDAQYLGFNDNKKIYIVIDVCEMFGKKQGCELNNDGFRYIIDNEYLVLYKEKTVGFIIE